MAPEMPPEASSDGPADDDAAKTAAAASSRGLMRTTAPTRTSAPAEGPATTARAAAPVRSGGTQPKDPAGPRDATRGEGGKGAPRPDAAKPPATTRTARPAGAPTAAGRAVAPAASGPGGAPALPPPDDGPSGPAGAQLPVPVSEAQASAAQVPATVADKAETGKVPAKNGSAGAKSVPAKTARDARPPRQTTSRTAPMSLAAIHAAMAGHHDGHDPLGIALATVVRITSAVWLAGAVIVWMRLVGYETDVIVASWHNPGGPWISTAVAAVVMPVISVGLWLAAPWGIVLWASALLAAVVAAILSPDSVPFGILALVGNIAALALAVGLAVLKTWKRHDGPR